MSSLFCYFFKKLLKAMKIIPQSIAVANINTTKAAPEICIISVPPYIQPRNAHTIMSNASNPRIQPTTFAEPFTVGLS